MNLFAVPPSKLKDGVTYRKGSLGHKIFGDNIQIDDGYKTKHIYEQYRVICYICLLFEATGILTTISYYEYSRSGLDDGMMNLLLYLMLSNMIALIISISMKTLWNSRYKASCRVANIGQGLISRFSYNWVIDLITCLFLPSPLWKNFYWISMNFETGIRYRVYLNDALCVLIIFRVIPFATGLICSTEYYSMRMQNIGRMLGFDADFIFSLKCLIKKNPFSTLSIAFLGSVFVFSFSIRACELPLRTIVGDVDFSDYAKVYWFTIVTMTTVGYGDITPFTLPGRAISFVMCIWGVFLVSMMVLTLLQKMKLTDEENLALTVYRILELKKELKTTSASIIQACFILNSNSASEAKRSKSNIHYWKTILSKSIIAQKDLRAELDTIGDPPVPFFDELGNHIHFVKDSINSVSIRQKKLFESCEILYNLLKHPEFLDKLRT